MYVEDLFIKIRDKLTDITLFFRPSAKAPFNGLLDDQWHHDFIQSLGQTIDQGKPLSTKQGVVALKIIKMVQPHLIDFGWITEEAIEQLIENPQFRIEPYKSKYIPKEVRYLGDNLLAFRFKKNDVLRQRIKTLCYPKKQSFENDDVSIRLRYDWFYKIWIVPVYRFNILAIIQLVNEERFGMDFEVDQYLKLATASFNQSSMFTVSEDILLANVCDDPILAGWITEVANGIAL